MTESTVELEQENPLWPWLLILVLIGIMCSLLYYLHVQGVYSARVVAFASCLRESNVVLYEDIQQTCRNDTAYAENCTPNSPWTVRQLEYLGRDAYLQLHVIECYDPNGLYKRDCSVLGLTGIPSWVRAENVTVNGTTHVQFTVLTGYQNFTTLSNFSGCVW